MLERQAELLDPKLKFVTDRTVFSLSKPPWYISLLIGGYSKKFALIGKRFPDNAKLSSSVSQFLNRIAHAAINRGFPFVSPNRFKLHKNHVVKKPRGNAFANKFIEIEWMCSMLKSRIFNAVSNVSSSYIGRRNSFSNVKAFMLQAFNWLKSNGLVGIPNDKCGVIALMPKLELHDMISEKLGPAYQPVFKHTIKPEPIFKHVLVCAVGIQEHLSRATVDATTTFKAVPAAKAVVANSTPPKASSAAPKAVQADVAAPPLPPPAAIPAPKRRLCSDDRDLTKRPNRQADSKLTAAKTEAVPAEVTAMPKPRLFTDDGDLNRARSKPKLGAAGERMRDSIREGMKSAELKGAAPKAVQADVAAPPKEPDANVCTYGCGFKGVERRDRVLHMWNDCPKRPSVLAQMVKSSAALAKATEQQQRDPPVKEEPPKTEVPLRARESSSSSDTDDTDAALPNDIPANILIQDASALRNLPGAESDDEPILISHTVYARADQLSRFGEQDAGASDARSSTDPAPGVRDVD